MTRKSANHESFPPGVARKLKTYVYRLIDPRNGETFYVGKGKGNRVFSHMRGEQKIDSLSDSLPSGRRWIERTTLECESPNR